MSDYKEEKENLTIYQQIARRALMAWNGLSEEEATRKVQESSNEELEQQVGAKGSIWHALQGIEKYIQDTAREYEVVAYPKGYWIEDCMNSIMTTRQSDFESGGDALNKLEANLYEAVYEWPRGISSRGIYKRPQRDYFTRKRSQCKRK